MRQVRRQVLLFNAPSMEEEIKIEESVTEEPVAESSITDIVETFFKENGVRKIKRVYLNKNVVIREEVVND